MLFVKLILKQWHSHTPFHPCLEQEFCLLVHLLYCLQAGHSLPGSISHSQGRALLGLPPVGAEEVPRLQLGRLRALLADPRETDDSASDAWTSRQTSPTASSIVSASERLGTDRTLHRPSPALQRASAALAAQLPRQGVSRGCVLVRSSLALAAVQLPCQLYAATVYFVKSRTSRPCLQSRAGRTRFWRLRCTRRGLCTGNRWTGRSSR